MDRNKKRVEHFTCGAARSNASGAKMALHFIGVFLTFIGVFYVLALSPWVDANMFFPVMKVSARAASALLNLAGDKTTAEGVEIRGLGYAVAVRRGCDPLEPIVLFAAGMMAFPATWRQRLIGLAIGGSFLFLLNLLRIASLFLLGANKSALLDSFHLCWWPAFFIVCSLVLWVLWLRWVQSVVPSSKSDSLASAQPQGNTPLPADTA
jgi:exosortase H (IPTLxxWG-CTERM-specific)